MIDCTCVQINEPLCHRVGLPEVSGGAGVRDTDVVTPMRKGSLAKCHIHVSLLQGPESEADAV